MYVQGGFLNGIVLNVGPGGGSTITNTFRDTQITGLLDTGTACDLDGATSTLKTINGNLFENVICGAGAGGYALRAINGNVSGNTLINENTFINCQFYSGLYGVYVGSSSALDLTIIGGTIESNDIGVASAGGNSIYLLSTELAANGANISDPSKNISGQGGRGPELSLAPIWARGNPVMAADTGVAFPGSGYTGLTKTAEAVGCATAIPTAAGDFCDTTVIWPTPFIGSYRVVCGGLLDGGLGHPVDGGMNGKFDGSVTFRTVASTATTAQFGTVFCTGIHN